MHFFKSLSNPLDLINTDLSNDLRVGNKHGDWKVVEYNGEIKCQKVAPPLLQRPLIWASEPIRILIKRAFKCDSVNKKLSRKIIQLFKDLHEKTNKQETLEEIDAFFKKCKESPELIFPNLTKIYAQKESLSEIIRTSNNLAHKASKFISSSASEELIDHIDKEITFHKRQVKKAEAVLRSYSFTSPSSRDEKVTSFPKQLQKSAPLGAQELFEAIQTSSSKEEREKLFHSDSAQWILKAAHEENCFEVAFWLTKNGTPLPGSTNIRFKELAHLNFSTDPEDIDYHAVELGYGYKAANLSKMAKHLETMQKKMCQAQLQVPPFAGISHHQVKHFLSQHVPELDSLWEEFLSTFGSDKQAIPEAGKAVLQKVQDKIKAAFEGEDSLVDLNAQLFLQDSPAKFVIVRSTGKEDSDTNANAGGNDSVPFVPTEDPKKIREAMGQVIASYFGEKSITQRLQNGDQSVFDEPPFFPVLIQDMIFEDYKPGAPTSLENLPRSGVLFTKEEGKDPNVVTINCAFGSNEGVVSSQVDVDTFQVHMKTGQVYPIVRNKKSRFVQQEDSAAKSGFSVGPVENSQEFATERCLSTLLAMDLSRLARGFGQLYGSDGKCKEMDMEFTITYKKAPKGELVPTIHPLQIRPLEKAKKSTPSYLSKEALKASEEKGNCFKLSTLLDGGSSLRRIQSPEEYIVTDDITKALKEYQSRGDKRDRVQLIVLAKTAPLTSHEAVTLRPKGIPVLVAGEKDFSFVSKTLAKASLENPIVACSQRGRILSLSSQEVSSCEKKGQISYPAERALSLSLLDRSKTVDTLRALLSSNNLQYTNLLSKLQSDGTLPSQSDSLEKLFEEMASEDRQEALRALIAFLKRTRSLVLKSLQTSTPFPIAIETVHAYKKIMDIVENHYLLVLEDEQSSVIERLFPLKQMEAVLMQSTSGASIVDGFSIAENAKVATWIKKYSGKESNTNSRILYLRAMGQFALQKPVQKQWDDFVKSLNPSTADQITQDLKILDKHKLLPFFMNVTFKTLHAQSQSILANMSCFSPFFSYPKKENLPQALHEEVLKATQSLEAVNQKLSTVEEWEGQKGLWQNPSFFDKQKAKLGNQLAQVGFAPTTSPWPKMFQDSSLLGKMAILNFLNRSVTCYDEMIKQLTGSSEYEGKKQLQAKNFHHLLKGYMDMLEVHMNLCKTQSGHEVALMQPGRGYQKSMYTFKEFLTTGKSFGKSLGNRLNACLTKIDAPSFSEAEAKTMMEARQEFNVSAVAVGSKSDLDFSIIWPTSLEELFTTFHQSMEAINKFEQTALGINKSIVPKHLETICSSMEKSGFPISRMDVNYPEVEVVYQIALRQHSMQVTLKTDLSKPEKHFTFEVQAFGNEEENRWAQTACLGSLLAHLVPGCSFANGSPTIHYPNPAGSGVSFQLKIDADACPKIASFGGLVKEFFCSGGIAFDGKEDTEGHIKKITSTKYPATNSLLNGLSKQTPAGDAWLDLPGPFYEHTLYPNLSAMLAAFEKNNAPKLVEIAKGTLFALKKYQLGKEFDHSYYTYKTPLSSSLSSQEGAEKFLQDSALTDASHRSLLRNAALALWYVATNAKAPAAIESVLSEPEIKAAYPTLVASLETLNLNSQEKAQKLLSKSDVDSWISALYLAKEHGLHPFFEAAAKKIQQGSTDKKEVFKKLYSSKPSSWSATQFQSFISVDCKEKGLVFSLEDMRPKFWP